MWILQDVYIFLNHLSRSFQKATVQICLMTERGENNKGCVWYSGWVCVVQWMGVCGTVDGCVWYSGWVCVVQWMGVCGKG